MDPWVSGTAARATPPDGSRPARSAASTAATASAGGSSAATSSAGRYRIIAARTGRRVRLPRRLLVPADRVRPVRRLDPLDVLVGQGHAGRSERVLQVFEPGRAHDRRG